MKGYPKANYIISGFTEGFKLNFHGKNQSLSSSNSPSASTLPEVIDATIENELSLARIAGPYSSPPFQHFKSSPLALRQKKEGGRYRMLHNLSYLYNSQSVNANIPQEFATVSYSSITDAIHLIQKCSPNVFLAKSDISEAYRLVPIHPTDYHLTGFQWKNLYYYDRCLPQGCRSSCQIFETISSAFLWILKTHFGYDTIVKVLDDFLFVASSRETCQEMLISFQNLADTIGLPLAPHKTVGPTKVLTFLGIELDVQTHTARLPPEKLSLYSENINKVLSSSKITLKELQSLIGQLQFSTSVVRYGKAFIRRLIDQTMGVSKPFYYIRVRKDEKEDLRMWRAFLRHYNGVTIIRPPSLASSDSVNMYTDACKLGFGGTFGRCWIQEKFPNNWSTYSITFLEIYPIYVLLSVFAHKLRNSKLTFYCDNEAVVTILNKQTSKNKDVMHVVRFIDYLQLLFNFSIVGRHIPGHSNVLADRLSRFQVSSATLHQFGMQEMKTTVPPLLLPENFSSNWTTCLESLYSQLLLTHTVTTGTTL